MFAPVRRTGLTAALILSFAVLAFHPRTAHATTYCVINPACTATAGTSTPAGASTSAQLVTALDTASASPGNTVSIGAGTIVMTANGDDHSGAGHTNGVTVVGSGQGSTTLETDTGNVVPLLLRNDGSSASNLSIRLGSATVALGLELEGATSATDVTVTGPAATSVVAGSLINASDGLITLTRVHAAWDTTCPVYTGMGDSAAQGLYVHTTGLNTSVTAYDSSFAGCYGVNAQSDGASTSLAVTLQRDHVTGTDCGLRSYAPQNPTSVRAYSSVIRATGPSGGGSVAVESRGDFDMAANVSNVFLYDDTIINDSPIPSLGPGYLNKGILLDNGSGTHEAANVTVLRSIIDVTNAAAPIYRSAGSANATFTGSYDDIVGDGSGQLNVDNSVQGASDPLIAPTNITGFPVTYVDAANGNYAPAWRSAALTPTVDYGQQTTAGLQPAESNTDITGRARAVAGPGSTMAYLDTGAYEYQHKAPTVTLSSAPTTGTVGVPVTYTAVGADADPGEAAALTYAWRLPGGGTASGSSVTFTAITAGTEAVELVVTDPSGLSVSPPVPLLMVSAAPITITETPPSEMPPAAQPTIVPTAAAPTLRFTAFVAKLRSLLASKAITLVATASATAKVTAVFAATVTTVTKVKGKRHVKTTKVRIGTAMASSTAAAKVTLTFRASKPVAAKLLALAKSKGTTIKYTLTTTVYGTSGATRTIVSVLRVR